MILTNEISAITTDRDRMISKLDYIISGNKRREITFDERFYWEFFIFKLYKIKLL